jgi:hypothetical protein
MAYTPVQNAKGVGTTTCPVTVSALTTGNRLFIFGSANSTAGTLSVSVNAGAISLITTIGPIDNTARAYVWEYQITTGGATTVTVTNTAAVSTEGFVVEASYTGTPAAAVSQTGSTTSTQTHNLGASVSYVSGDIVIQGCHATSAAAFSAAAGGWALIGGATGTRGGAQYLAPAGSSTTLGGMTSAANETTATILVTFSSPVGGGGARATLVGGKLVGSGLLGTGLVH